MAETANHIVILCSRLDLAGGIERAVVNTANLFASKGHTITLLILDETKECFFPLHPSVTVIQQPLSFGITKDGNVITRKIRLLTDVLKLKKLFKQLEPTVIITSEYPFAVAGILTGIRKKVNVISWEHHHYHELKRNNFWERIFLFTYPKLRTVVCLNKDEEKLFAAVNPNCTVIPNFIETSGKAVLENKKIITVARLTDVKGIDLLLKAAVLVLKKHPGWQWKLIGDGELKEDVLGTIEKEGLKDRLILQAPVHHSILTEYQEASIYVMSSRNECFPMTLLEAQSVGMPCISFDCDTGPRHIILQNENGMLVEKEDPLKLAEAISLLITNEDLRKKMGENAFSSVKRFSPENIYALWKTLVTQATKD